MKMKKRQRVKALLILVFLCLFWSFRILSEELPVLIPNTNPGRVGVAPIWPGPGMHTGLFPENSCTGSFFKKAEKAEKESKKQKSSANNMVPLNLMTREGKN